MSAAKANIVLLSITAVWGLSFILMKNISETVSPMGFLTLRFGVAAIALLIIFRRRLKDFDTKTWLRSAFLSLFLIGYMVFQLVGLRTTSASNSGFITSLNVLIVPLLSVLLLKKRPSRSNVAGVLLAVIGFGILIGIWDSRTALTNGDLLTFFCAVICALHIIIVDNFTGRSDALLLGIGQTAGAAVFSLILWVIMDGGGVLRVDFSAALAVSVLTTALLCTAYGFTAQVVMQKYVTPTKLALFFLFEPVFALFYALVIPSANGVTETLTPERALGCLIIIAGMLISELGLINRKNTARQ